MKFRGAWALERQVTPLHCPPCDIPWNSDTAKILSGQDKNSKNLKQVGRGKKYSKQRERVNRQIILDEEPEESSSVDITKFQGGKFQENEQEINEEKSKSSS